MSEPKKLLLIEDDPGIRRFLRASLDPAEYRVLEAEDGAAGLRRAATDNPDVLLLDLGLPDADGVDVVRTLREWSQVPVIVLSARGREQDKIAALDAGADDYLTKPFGIGELLARVRVALRHRRGNAAEPADFHAHGVSVDFPARRVIRDGVEIHLTPIEFRLLATLIRESGRVLTHRQILTEVWGPAYAQENHYLRVYMGQLRHKLEADPGQPRLLITEPGVGYRLQPD